MSSSDPIDPLVREYAERLWRKGGKIALQYENRTEAEIAFNRMSELMTSQPLVIVNITGGVEQWTITSPGLGEPDVHIFDFDDEMDLDDQKMTLDRWDEVIKLADGRVPNDTLLQMIDTRADMAERIDELEEYLRLSSEKEDHLTKRQRAADLLTDAEIDDINRRTLDMSRKEATSGQTTRPR